MKLYQIKKYVKKKNTLISGNAGDEKIFNRAAGNLLIFNQFNLFQFLLKSLQLKSNSKNTFIC